MSDTIYAPETAETRALRRLIAEGRMLTAAREAARMQARDTEDLQLVAGGIGLCRWLADEAVTEGVRLAAARVMRALGAVWPAWESNAEPVPAGGKPGDLAAFEALCAERLRGKGYHHPVPLPANGGWRAPDRTDAGIRSRTCHEYQWSLVRRHLERLRGGPLAGARVLDAGCVDGYFSIKLAQAGARVLAVDSSLPNVVRTAVFSALSRTQDRITVKMAAVGQVTKRLVSTAGGGRGAGPVDAVLALGPICRVGDVEQDLETLLAIRAPLILDVNARAPDDGTRSEPSAYRRGAALSLPWLAERLAERGFTVTRELGWTAFTACLPDQPHRSEMIVAVPRKRL